MQSVIIIGNLGSDPIVKSFDNGGKVANFNVGVTERGYKTEWFRCVVKQTGLCGVVEQYVKKGNKVCITGKLRTREYEDKGEKKKVTELLVDSLELLTPKNSTDAATQTTQPVQQPSQTQQEKDDLPF